MPNFEDLGKLVLRIVVAGLMLPHGMAKFGEGTVQKLGGMLSANGLPEFFAYGVYVGEVLAPILMLIGYFTRPAAAIFAFNMVVAVGLAHRGDLVSFNPQSGGYVLEVQALYLFGGLAIMLLGAGKFSISGGEGKWD